LFGEVIELGYRVLIVDDDEKIISMLRRSLAFEGYDVSTARNGLEALDFLFKHEAAMVVLDVMMPLLDGWEVCRRIRNSGSTIPILMLTARDEVQHRVHGLDVGADDYLVKPFALEELLARVRALIRRSAQMSNHSQDVANVLPGNAHVMLHFDDLEMDLDAREVSRNGKRLELTTKEFDLLHLFMQNPRRVLQRDFIMDKIWGFDFSGESNVLEVYVATLRQKTEEAGGRRLIQTIRGAGYVLRQEQG
jgi:two-component system response regulator MprA